MIEIICRPLVEYDFYNTIYSDEEYMAQGFSAEEVPLIRRHDILFNKYRDEEITPEEMEEMYSLVHILKI